MKVVLTGEPGRPSTPGNPLSPFFPYEKTFKLDLGIQLCVTCIMLANNIVQTCICCYILILWGNVLFSPTLVVYFYIWPLGVSVVLTCNKALGNYQGGNLGWFYRKTSVQKKSIQSHYIVYSPNISNTYERNPQACTCCYFHVWFHVSALHRLSQSSGCHQLSDLCRGGEASLHHHDARCWWELCWEWLNLKQLNHKVHSISSGAGGGQPVIPALSPPAYLQACPISPPNRVQPRRSDPKEGEIMATRVPGVEL